MLENTGVDFIWAYHDTCKCKTLTHNLKCSTASFTNPENLSCYQAYSESY